MAKHFSIATYRIPEIKGNTLFHIPMSRMPAGFTTEFNFGTLFLEIFFSEEEEEEYHEYDTIEGPRAPL